MHNFAHCALSYCDKYVCVVVAYEVRMLAVLRLQISERITVKQTTVENKTYNEEEL